MPISPDAILAGVITVGLAGLLALWKLATMLAEVRGQVRTNGGSTLKDNALLAATESVAAREAAVIARELAAKVAVDLVEFRSHQADQADAQRRQISRVQHDVTNVRTGQELLLERQDLLDARVSSHGAQIADLQVSMDAGAERDVALGHALHESLDVALAVEDASGETSG